jgi:lysozyme
MASVRRGAAVAALILVLTPHWEGMDLTAKPDRLANGLLTWCIGQTTYDDKTVKPGQKFTVPECLERFKKDIPRYLAPIEKCVHVDLTDHQWSSLFDASYNAGPAAVCKSPMVNLFNAGQPDAACDAFANWHEYAGGQWRKGLANRRRLDPKWSDRTWCKMPNAENSP